jgi:hypothetical protein
MGNTIKYLIFCLAMVAAWLAADHFMPAHWVDNGAYWGLLFFGVITGVSLYVGLKGIDQNDIRFVTHINGAITIKLLGGMIFLIIFLLNFTENKTAFVVNFFIQYLLFTVFEITSFITTLRPQKKS